MSYHFIFFKDELNFVYGQSTLGCEHCGYQNSLLPARHWMQKILVKKRRPMRIVGAEDAEYEKNFYKSARPVVTSCIKCGSNLEINPDTPRNAECRYCQTLQFLPDPLWFSLHPIKTKKTWYIEWSKTVR